MIRTHVGKAVFLFAAAALGAGAAIVGCARHAGPSEDLGAVTVALTLSPGVTVNTVTYSITGNGIMAVNGSIDVTNSTHATALVGGIAAGNGYLLAMDATSTDGLTTCHGQTNFNVVAGQTASASVVLQCRGPHGNNTGTVAISGRLDNCPFISGYSATALETSVGRSVTVAATATDPDAGDIITYAWTAVPAGVGTLGTPAAASTTFTCTSVGTASLSIAVSDSICGDSLSNIIPINCVAAPAGGTGGTPGTGGVAGNPGTGGVAGNPGTGGVAGNPGTGGVAGNPGTGGVAGNPGTGGVAGNPGTGGVAGNPGTGGVAGNPGTGGVMACSEPVSGNQPLCCTCTTDNCSLAPNPNGTDGCEGLATAADQALCAAAATCFQHGACTVGGDAARCFCGNSAAACFSTVGAANGPCTAQVIAAAKTSDPATIQSVFTSPASPLGRAVNLLGCQGQLCGTECSVP